MENKIKIDSIVGTSAGALFGVNYFSNQKGRVIRYNKEYCNDRRYMSIKSLLLTGNYINKDFAYYRMSRELDQFDNLAFINANKEFYAVATNVETGEPTYFNITSPLDQLEELRASSAIPMLSKMVKINNEKYLDGGLSDSIPLAKAIGIGCNKIIVIETQPKNYRKKPFNKNKEKFLKLRFFKYPKLVETMLTRYKKYNERKMQIAKMERAGDIFVIRASKKLNISITNKDEQKYQEVYDLGVADAKEAIKELKKYLRKKIEKDTKETVVPENKKDLEAN